MGQWIQKKDSHQHDNPLVWPEPVGIGSTWQCSCDVILEVIEATLEKGERVRQRGYDIKWKLWEKTPSARADGRVLSPPLYARGESEQSAMEIR